MTYGTFVFIEIVESIKGILFIRAEEREDVKIRVYQGLTGKTVIIDVSDEDIVTEQGKGYLRQLGLEYLIPSMFPASEPQSSTAVQPSPPAVQDVQKN
jgi:hypothetical protein